MDDNNTPQQQIYYIPENFVGESRLFQGRISTRRLIDSLMLALIVFVVIVLPLLAFGLSTLDTQIKIILIILLLAPPIIIGQVGYNGDPISVAMKNLSHWFKTRETRIYNSTPILLKTDPVRILQEQRANMDKLVGTYQDFQQRRIDKLTNQEYIQGENFEFEYDPGIEDYTEESNDYQQPVDKWPIVNVKIEEEDNIDSLKELLALDPSYYEN